MLWPLNSSPGAWEWAAARTTEYDESTTATTVVSTINKNVLETIPKPPLAETQTALEKQKYVMWNAGICFIAAIMWKTAIFNWNWAIGCWFMAKKRFSIWRVPARLNKKIIFSHVTVEFQNVLLCTSVHQNRMVFRGDMAIWPFAIWQPSAMLNFRNLEFMSRVFIAMLFCFSVQNFTEIGQSIAELWPKTIFAARCYASAALAVMRCLSVWLSVRPSVTFVHCA